MQQFLSSHSPPGGNRRVFTEQARQPVHLVMFVGQFYLPVNEVSGDEESQVYQGSPWGRLSSAPVGTL